MYMSRRRIVDDPLTIVERSLLGRSLPHASGMDCANLTPPQADQPSIKRCSVLKVYPFLSKFVINALPYECPRPNYEASCKYD